MSIVKFKKAVFVFVSLITMTGNLSAQSKVIDLWNGKAPGAIPAKAANIQPDSIVTQSDSTTNLPDKDGVYFYADKMPVYPGGEMAIMNFICKNVRYPIDAMERGIQGTVIVRFVVNQSGKIEKSQILKSVYPSINTEAKRIVNLLENWTPAEQNAEKVSTYYTLPIKFKLANKIIDPNHPVFVLDGITQSEKFNLDSINKENVKSIDYYKPDTKEQTLESMTKEDQLIQKYGKNATNGIVFITSKKPSNDPIKVYKKGTLIAVDKKPQYPTGEEGLMKFIIQNLKYPTKAAENGIQGKVIISFTIDKTGKVVDPHVICSVEPSLDEEAIRVVKMMQNWIPGEQKGEKVAVEYILPFNFRQL